VQTPEKTGPSLKNIMPESPVADNTLSRNPDPVSDTIVAIATPPGRGGIGIVRLSGPGSLACALPLLAGAPAVPHPRQTFFCRVVDPATRQPLDEVLVTWFAAPRSYTGEDVVEISAHGAPVLLLHLVHLLMEQGAQAAGPGEFTQRAFLNGKLDLTQAEAVRDLVEAETLGQAQLAARQLGGSLARSIAPSKQQLVTLIATLEAGIDFAEDDTPVLDEAAVAGTLARVREELARLAASFAQGRLLTQGLRIAVVGRPNVGKSSLFNRLVRHDRAIVTSEAGTTRDTVEERLTLAGIPIRLVDTAGLRQATSEAERIGIERSREAFADADLILLVLEATASGAATASNTLMNRVCAASGLHTIRDEPAKLELELAQTAAGRPLIVVNNKADLLAPQRLASKKPKKDTLPDPVASNGLSEAMAAVLPPGTPIIWTSAFSGEGVDLLEQAIVAQIDSTGAIFAGATMLTNTRQHAAVTAALAALDEALAANTNGLPHEMLLLDAYGALRALDTLTGTTTPDDILHLVFSTFCIGK
jgi:tRNA modification GTPase